MNAKNVGDPGQPVQEWNDVKSLLDQDRFASLKNHPNRYSLWLTTINADGSPHVTAVGAVWDSGTFWFQTGEVTKKARNLMRDPRCAMSLGLDEFDFVLNGTAQKVNDPADVARIVGIWNNNGWPCEVDETGIGITAPFNAPGLGTPPWFVYRIAATSATSVLAAEPGGATRFTF
jgi:hypothetical protein